MASREPIHDPKHMKEYDKRRQKRADRLFHWSLDMPPEEDDVDVRVKNGVTWKEMAVVAGSLFGAHGIEKNGGEEREEGEPDDEPDERWSLR